MRLGFADPLSAPFLRVLRREWAGRKTVAGEGVRSGRRGRTDGLGVSSWIQGTLDWSLWLSRRRLIRFCSAGVLVTVRAETSRSSGHNPLDLDQFLIGIQT
ncbi:phosphatidylinositol-4-phosphate 5-kinase family protein [Striga asiatica]|uniref:Phosphatidylinositol-4-phosphate 5-kinase family protein n=1 Tax=Striga asiatica TaxID=4170 RepID=A0A5A7QE44_STRAF|nr:phosphatidylinositol-4-phosphate 5-kinase family protein [Striga asiatica]